MSDKIEEGIKSIERIKLLMGYSLHETLSENIEHILTEQYNYQPKPFRSASMNNIDNTYLKPLIQPIKKNIVQPKIPIVKKPSVNYDPTIVPPNVKSYLTSISLTSGRHPLNSTLSTQ